MTHLEQLVLDALNHQLHPLTVREIHDYVSARRFMWFGLNYGGIYAALIRLEARGIAQSQFIAGAFPRRRVYQRGVVWNPGTSQERDVNG